MNPDGLLCDYPQSWTTFVAFIECVNNATLVIIQQYSSILSPVPYAMCVCESCDFTPSPKATTRIVLSAATGRGLESM